MPSSRWPTPDELEGIFIGCCSHITLFELFLFGLPGLLPVCYGSDLVFLWVFVCVSF